MVRWRAFRPWILCFLWRAFGSWSRVSDLADPVDPAGPPARSAHIGFWDASRQALLIHGGSDLAGDLWQFAAATGAWMQVGTAVAPAARASHAAGWDAGNQALWVHGGYNSETSTWFRDVWKLQSGTWMLEFNDGGPCGRQAHVAVWDSSTAALWVHGGWSGSILLSDLWQYNSRTGRWQELAVFASSAPSARSHHVAVWDGTSEALWLHGGYSESLLGDLWAYDTSSLSWTEIAFEGGPTRRSGHTAVWDDANRAFWLHGGNDGFLRRDLWRFEPETKFWSLVADHSGPSGRWSHVAAWDGRSQTMYVHGGYNGSLCGDLWSFWVTTTSTTYTASQTSSSTSTSTTSSSSTTGSTTTRTSSTSLSATSSSTSNTGSSTSSTSISSSSTTHTSSSSSTSQTSVSSSTSTSSTSSSTSSRSSSQTFSTSTSTTSTSTTSTSTTSSSSASTSSSVTVTSRTFSTTSATHTTFTHTFSTQTTGTSSSSTATTVTTTSTTTFIVALPVLDWLLENVMFVVSSAVILALCILCNYMLCRCGRCGCCHCLRLVQVVPCIQALDDLMPQTLPDRAKPPPPAPAFARPVPCRSPAPSLAVVVHFQGAPKSSPRVGLVPGSPAWPPGGKRPQWKEAQVLDGAGLPTLLQSRTHAGQRLQRRPPQSQPAQPGTQPAIPHAPPNTAPSAPSCGTQLEPAKRRPSQRTVPCKFPCLVPLAARSRPRAKLVPESLPWPACAGPPREPKPLPALGGLPDPTPVLPCAELKRRPTRSDPNRRPKDVAPLVRVRRKRRPHAAPALMLVRLEPPTASTSARANDNNRLLLRPQLDRPVLRSRPRLRLVPPHTLHPPPTLREPRSLTPRSRGLGRRRPKPLVVKRWSPPWSWRSLQPESGPGPGDYEPEQVPFDMYPAQRLLWHQQQKMRVEKYKHIWRSLPKAGSRSRTASSPPRPMSP